MRDEFPVTMRTTLWSRQGTCLWESLSLHSSSAIRFSISCLRVLIQRIDQTLLFLYCPGCEKIQKSSLECQFLILESALSILNSSLDSVPSSFKSALESHTKPPNDFVAISSPCPRVSTYYQVLTIESVSFQANGFESIAPIRSPASKSRVNG
jgi:hypothetical protein